MIINRFCISCPLLFPRERRCPDHTIGRKACPKLAVLEQGSRVLTVALRKKSCFSCGLKRRIEFLFDCSETSVARRLCRRPADQEMQQGNFYRTVPADVMCKTSV